MIFLFIIYCFLGFEGAVLGIGNGLAGVIIIPILGVIDLVTVVASGVKVMWFEYEFVYVSF